MQSIDQMETRGVIHTQAQNGVVAGSVSPTAFADL